MGLKNVGSWPGPATFVRSRFSVFLFFCFRLKFTGSGLERKRQVCFLFCLFSSCLPLWLEPPSFRISLFCLVLFVSLFCFRLNFKASRLERKREQRRNSKHNLNSSKALNSSPLVLICSLVLLFFRFFCFCFA